MVYFYNLDLTLKAPITTAADDIHKYFSFFSKKIRLGISCKSSARQRIHMNFKPYFLRKIKVKKIKVSSSAILFGALRVKVYKLTFGGGGGGGGERGRGEASLSLSILPLVLTGSSLNRETFWRVSFAPEFQSCYFCESSGLFYLSFNF